MGCGAGQPGAFAMRLRTLSWLAAAILVLAATVSQGWAEGGGLDPGPDKSGIGPKAVSLPSGPGSIRGFGASYAWQVSGNKGASRYTIGIQAPKGPAGQAPQLQLVYGSDLGMGALGLGWRLALPYVERDTVDRLPIYGHKELRKVFREARESFRSDAGDKLVQVDGGDFFAEHETRFVRYRRLDEGWEASMPDGDRLYFGTRRQSRLSFLTRRSERVFRWLPERLVDLHGNETRFLYTESDRETTPVVPAKYLARIEYGAGPAPWKAFFLVNFEYEERPDKVLDGKPGFLVENGRRLVAVEVLVQGASRQDMAIMLDRNGDGVDEQLIRRYRFDYKPQDRFNALSLVGSVIETGRDGETSLPPVLFDYTAPGVSLDEPVSLRPAILSGKTPGFQSLSVRNVEIVDLNGDALPDLLMTPGRHGWPHRALLNLGVAEVASQLALRFSGVRELSGDEASESVTLAADPQDAVLADFNGDGRVDLGYRDALRRLQYFPSTGDVGWGMRKQLGDRTGVPQRFAGAGSSTRQADLDGDRRIDLVSTSADGSRLRVWFCLETGYSELVNRNCPESENCDFRNKTTRLSDMTGDGQPDLVWMGQNVIRVAPGLGFGRFSSAITHFAVPGSGGLSPQELEASRLVDVTGDGLSDLVVGPQSGAIHLAINQGGVGFSDWVVFTDAPARISASSKVRWADMNGNGSVDYVVLDDAANPSVIRFADLLVALNVAPKPNLLARVDNGLGSVVSIDYVSTTEQMTAARAAGRPWDTVLPFSVAVVSEVSEHTYPHREGSTVRYRYRDGIYALDQHENRGFELIREMQEGQDGRHPTLITEIRYDRGDRHAALKAKPLLQRLLDAQDQVWEETTTVWSTPPRPLYRAEGVPVVHFAHPVETTKLISGLGAAQDVVLKERFAYDDLGNVVRHEELGRADVDADSDPATDRRTRLTDYVIDTERWMLRAPARETLLDHAGNLVTRADYHYDDESFDVVRHGTISRGNLTMLRRWRGPALGDVQSGDPDPSAAEFVTETRNRYDAFGNVLVTLGPLAAIGADGEPTDTRGHIIRYTYDPLFQSRPIREEFVENASNRFTHIFEYDHGFGLLTGHEGPNGARSRFQYDALGRLTAISRPGDPHPFPSTRYNYVFAHTHEDGGRISWIETQLLDAPPTSEDASAGANPLADEHYFRSRRFLDGAGRALYTKSEGAETPDGAESTVAVGIASFTRRGKMASSLNPCVSTLRMEVGDDPFAWENPFDPAWRCDSYYGGRWHWLGYADTPQTRRHYDVLSREIRSDNPDGTWKEIHYAPLERTLEDENVVAGLNGAPLTYHSDGLGRLVAITERPRAEGEAPGERQAWRTEFYYDAADRMTGIVNAEGARRAVVYDGLGRIMRLSDPEFGSHAFTFDAASNLTAATDSEGRTAHYAYDGVGRLVSETHTQAGNEDTIQIDYRYDLSRNGRGRLGMVTDAVGSLRLDYDLRGRETSQVRRFGPVFGGREFRASHHYDALDRLTARVYPDGDRMTFRYNRRNLLQTVTFDSLGDVISEVGYGPDEQPHTLVFGNGMLRHHTYDRRARPRRTELLDAAGGALLFEETLSFDLASNIVARNRRMAGSAPWSLREAFGHDDLHRLTSVSYTPPIVGGVRGLSYRYGRIGTLLSAQVEQEAGGGEPARVELSLPMPRDTTGRVTALGDITLAWNPQGRLKTATSPTTRIANVYDYGGSRIWRHETRNAADDADAVTTSLFPLSDYEEKDGRGEKVIRFAGAPVARVNAVSEVDGVSAARPSIAYFHPDHLGSPLLALDEGREIVGEQLLYPFGAVARTEGVGMSRGFTGARRESKLGLAAFDARYLHEATGRFLSPDPALLNVAEPPLSPQFLYPYAYSMNRPLSYIDPDGRSPVPVSAAGAPGKRTLGSYLPFTRAGHEAAQYWADRLVRAGGRIRDDPVAATGLLFASLWTPETAVDTLLTTLVILGPGAVAVTAKAISPVTKLAGLGLVRNWVRLKGSYSTIGTFRTGLSLSWGSKALHYLKEIKNVRVRGMNAIFRTTKFPVRLGWRTQDAGHLHIFRSVDRGLKHLSLLGLGLVGLKVGHNLLFNGDSTVRDSSAPQATASGGESNE